MTSSRALMSATGRCVTRPEKCDVFITNPAVRLKSILLSADVTFQSGAATPGLAAVTRRSLSVCSQTERVKQMEVLNHLL